MPERFLRHVLVHGMPPAEGDDLRRGVRRAPRSSCTPSEPSRSSPGRRSTAGGSFTFPATRTATSRSCGAASCWRATPSWRGSARRSGSIRTDVPIPWATTSARSSRSPSSTSWSRSQATTSRSPIRPPVRASSWSIIGSGSRRPWRPSPQGRGARYDVSLDVFGLELTTVQRRFALAESLAHLERLVREERAGAWRSRRPDPVPRSRALIQAQSRSITPASAWRSRCTRRDPVALPAARAHPERRRDPRARRAERVAERIPPPSG